MGAGTIDAVVAVMRAQVDESVVCFKACGVIIHLVENGCAVLFNVDYFADKVRALAGRAGAIDAVVVVMRANISDHELSGMALETIRHLCFRNGIALISNVDCVLFVCAVENCVLAVKAGVIDAVLAVMRAHVDDDVLSSKACLTLRSLCWNGSICCCCYWHLTLARFHVL